MHTLMPNDVVAALKSVVDPATNKDLITLELIQGLTVKDGHVSFALEVSPQDGRAKEPLRLAAERAVLALKGVRSVTAVLTAHKAPTSPMRRPPPTTSQPRAGELQGPAGVKAVVAVASGKGGVGKSTVAVNLAIALKNLGRSVGILDADIYGPSVPRMLGISGKPTSKDGKKLEPKEAWGLKAMSIGLLMGEDEPTIWRGPVVMTALTQLIYDVDWAPLDVLIVDMPPGTGDAQLTLAQRVPLAGAVIVSTPQDIALIDARKGLAMFKKTHVPVFGIVENMSTFVCPNCGHEEHIFGHGGARATAATLGCDFLGEIPLNITIRETSDAGTPITATKADSAQARAFIEIAKRVAAKLDAGVEKAPPRIVME